MKKVENVIVKQQQNNPLKECNMHSLYYLCFLNNNNPSKVIRLIEGLILPAQPFNASLKYFPLIKSVILIKLVVLFLQIIHCCSTKIFKPLK